MILNKQNLISKILYRSRYRGTKEMDIFVYSFAKSIINELSLKELEELSNLVDMNDEKIIELSESNDESKKSNLILKLYNYKKNI
tara:strand:+ start:259 stop:513 length:255 start_codon:yes stop_codon:yes gene_type:complete